MRETDDNQTQYEITGDYYCNTARPRGTDKAKIISVIATESIRGYGVKEDPVRIVYQYWDFEGNMLAEHDTIYEDKELKHNKEFKIEKVLNSNSNEYKTLDFLKELELEKRKVAEEK